MPANRTLLAQHDTIMGHTSPCPQGRCCPQCARQHGEAGCDQCRRVAYQRGEWWARSERAYQSNCGGCPDDDLVFYEEDCYEDDYEDDDEDDEEDDEEPQLVDADSPTSPVVIPAEYLAAWPSADSEDHDRLTLGGYSGRPSPIFHGMGRVFLGWELEFELPYELPHPNSRDMGPRDAACMVISHMAPSGLLYLKTDGSLQNGIEMVTHPMTYRWAERNFPWEMLDMLRDGCGAMSPAGAGLHVHVNRTAFTDTTHMFRWLRLMWRMQEQVNAIARRRTRWAQWDRNIRRSIKLIAKNGERSFERYAAVNVQNQETLEVRVFRSSMNRQEILAALALVDASVEYTRTLTSKAANDGGWTWAGLFAWLTERGTTYAPLLAEAERLDLCVS